MVKFIFKKGDMLDPNNINHLDIFLHVCNAQGKWGAGIAKQFKKIFPQAFLYYMSYQNKHGQKVLSKKHVMKLMKSMLLGMSGVYENVIIILYRLQGKGKA